MLMVRRSASARFMAGTLITGIDPDAELTPWLAAGFREVVEETGIWLTDPPFVAPVRGDSVYEWAARHDKQFAAGKAVYFEALDADLGSVTPKNPGLRPNESGFRDFGLGAQVLKTLGVDAIEVLTDNPRKIVGLEGFGIEVRGSRPLSGDA